MIKVLIISGGHIKAHNSISSGDNIYKEISNSIYKKIEVKRVHIDKDNNWHYLALPTNPYKILPQYDIAIDTTYHDNTHYYLAERMGVYNLINREEHQGYIRRAINQLGIDTPKFKLLKRGDHNNELFFDNLKEKIHREMNLPICVKSVYKKLPTLTEYNHDEIINYIKDIHKRDDCMIEEMIRGKTYTIIAMRDFRGESVYMTSIYELIKIDKSNKLINANYLSEKDKERIREISKTISLSFDFNIMKIDFVINKNGIKVTDISTNPEYVQGSPLFEIFYRHGINWIELINNRAEKLVK